MIKGTFTVAHNAFSLDIITKKGEKIRIRITDPHYYGVMSSESVGFYSQGDVEDWLHQIGAEVFGDENFVADVKNVYISGAVDTRIDPSEDEFDGILVDFCYLNFTIGGHQYYVSGQELTYTRDM